MIAATDDSDYGIRVTIRALDKNYTGIEVLYHDGFLPVVPSSTMTDNKVSSNMMNHQDAISCRNKK